MVIHDVRTIGRYGSKIMAWNDDHRRLGFLKGPHLVAEQCCFLLVVGYLLHVV